MNINLKLSGVAETVIQDMIESGYAASKTEAIRMALVSFKDKFLDKSELEKELVIRKMTQIDNDIKAGKIKLISAKDAAKEYPELAGLV